MSGVSEGYLGHSLSEEPPEAPSRLVVPPGQVLEREAQGLWEDAVDG